MPGFPTAISARNRFGSRTACGRSSASGAGTGSVSGSRIARSFIPALFGVWQAGAVAVPINNFLKPGEVQFILADAGIEVIILDESLQEGFATLAAARTGLKSLAIESFETNGRMAGGARPDAGEGELAVIIYTSGTTGHPKGAMLSHGNLLANVESCRLVLKAVGEDRFVVLLPMFHSFMLTVGLLLPMLVGGSIVLDQNAASAQKHRPGNHPAPGDFAAGGAAVFPRSGA